MKQHKIVCICGKCNPEALKQELLHEYTAWLVKHNYTSDTDAICEEPLAVDEFLKDKLNKNNYEKTKSI